MKASGMLAALLAAAALAAAGCGGGNGDETGETGDAQATEQADGTTLTVYSGRDEKLVGALFAAFEEATGITLEVRYGDSAELAATIAEEGESSPADVYFGQDAGALGAVAGEGLLIELPAELLERVDERYRDPDGRWVGTSGRARVVAYNTEAVSESELPSSVLELTDPRWKGKIGIPPTNASFQAFVTAMRLSIGDEETRRWLEGIKANEPKLYEKNSAVLEALAAGEIEVGLVNHYYLYLLRAEQPDVPVENHFLEPGDPGALVNVAGVGVLASSDDRDAAIAFVEYLLSDEGQRYYVEGTEQAEYPLATVIAPREGLPPLDSLQGPDITLGALGAELEATLELLNEVGFTS